MKAIHNLLQVIYFNAALLSIKQRYEMKAIHNDIIFNILLNNTVVNKAKIRNESNSQQYAGYYIDYFDCCQ